MSRQITSVKGTKDILPEESPKWRYIESIIHELAAEYNYREVRTPVFEETQLFARGVGEYTDIVTKEMYTFLDKGETSLTLKPELTAPVVRSYIQHHYDQTYPLSKLYYLTPLFRQERRNTRKRMSKPSPLPWMSIHVLGCTRRKITWNFA